MGLLAVVALAVVLDGCDRLVYELLGCEPIRIANQLQYNHSYNKKKERTAEGRFQSRQRLSPRQSSMMILPA
jgi:hypothetical protein